MRSHALVTPLLAGLVLLASACGSEPPPPAAPPAPPSPPVVPTATPPALATQQFATVHRSVVSFGRPSGSSVATTSPNGSMTIAFEEIENGRGPKSDATIRLAPDGTIASLSAHGHHMMQAPVEETFTLDAGHAQWKSREETGDKTVTGPTFFMPISDIPDTWGLLAQALLKAGGTMALLPAGEARIAKAGEATVQVAGKDQHLTAYAITGVGLTPQVVWMQDDGGWFGIVDPWFSVVPEGSESAIDPLVAKQLEMERTDDLATAKRLAHQPPAWGLALTNARVLDVEHGKWVPGQTVLVVGGVIKAIGPSKSMKVPAGAETIDLAGKALLPGLWDMHAHLSQPDGLLNIASGVTTVRDVGNDPDQLDDWKKRFDDGTAVGPHVLRAGFIEGRNPMAASSKITAENEAEARAGVEFYAKRGYEMMKIYNSVHPELVPVITKAAHAHGMTVTGHIPVHMLANEAVRAGYDGIEHVNMLFLNFLATHDTDTRTPLRFSVVGDGAADFDLTGKPAQDFFALLREHHTVIDPTVATFESTFVGRQGKITPGIEWMMSRLPVHAARVYLTGGLPSDGKEEKYARSYDKMLAMVRALTDAKVTVVTGTDDLAGMMLDHELELFVRGGLTPAEALRDATIVPARAMKLDKKTGSIAVGKTADLAVVDGDPLANISDARKVVTTVRGGVVYSAKDAFAAVGVKYWD